MVVWMIVWQLAIGQSVLTLYNLIWTAGLLIDNIKNSVYVAWNTNSNTKHMDISPVQHNT